jgi:hypothetical protein
LAPNVCHQVAGKQQFIYAFNFFTRISKRPTRAYTSAMGAINGPYGWPEYFVKVLYWIGK